MKYKWQCFILDYLEKKLKFLFSKNPTIFGPLRPFLGETECSSKFYSYQWFLKKLRRSFIVPKFKEVMNGFQATLVSEARMHTRMELAYHQTFLASYYSNSEINFLSVN